MLVLLVLIKQRYFECSDLNVLQKRRPTAFYIVYAYICIIKLCCLFLSLERFPTILIDIRTRIFFFLKRFFFFTNIFKLDLARAIIFCFRRHAPFRFCFFFYFPIFFYYYYYSCFVFSLYTYTIRG